MLTARRWAEVFTQNIAKIHGLVEKLNKLYFLHLIDILNDQS